MPIKTDISKIRDFINRESAYTWMLAFVLLLNAAFILSEKLPGPSEGLLQKEDKLEFKYDKTIPDEAALHRALEKNRFAFKLLNGLFFAGLVIFSLGLFLDLRILMAKLTKRELIHLSLRRLRPKWGIGDVFKLVIIFLFWGHILHLIEGTVFLPLAELLSISKTEGVIKIINFLNTGIMDLLILYLILYFVKVKYSQSLSALGLRIKNMGKLISLGILGYISFLPVLAFFWLLLIIIASLFNYHPPQQSWIRLFAQEQRYAVLTYLIILVVIFGPIVEEIFFRGFTYSAFKRKWGAIAAMTLTSVIFAGLHASVVGFFPIMALGFLLCYVYEKTGSLVPSITIHILHNAMIMSFLFLQRYFFSLAQ